MTQGAETHGQRSAVVCLTPNPCVERISTVGSFSLGAVNRAQDTRVAAGGKAVTVARTLSSLGHEAICIAPVGGEGGDTFARLADADDIRGDWVPVQGETRTNLTIISSEQETRDTILNEAGPHLDEQEWDAVTERVVTHSRNGAPVAIGGSVPPGVGADQLRNLVETLGGHGSPVYLDSSGSALRAMLDGKPACLKVNAEEAATLLGENLDSVESQAGAAQSLLSSVTEIAIITLGAQGALVADKSGLVALIEPPEIEVVSSVGSGDTFLGGLLAGLHARGCSTLDAVRFAAAAGAANSMSSKQGVISPEHVNSLCESTQVRVLQEAK